MKVVFLVACVIAGVLGFPERRIAVNNGCSTFCPMYIITFCGSDGKTYTSNPCFIKSQLCNEGINDYDTFHTLHYGACLGNELTAEPTTATTTTTTADQTIG